MSDTEKFIDALCMMEAGWTGEADGPAHRAYLEALKMILERAARARSREEEDAILAAADEIRARRGRQ